MKTQQNQRNSRWRRCLQLAALLTLGVILSGCYVTQESYQLARKHTQPLPYHFFLHKDEQSTGDGFPPIITGLANERMYDVAFGEAPLPASFEPIDRKKRLYWAQMHAAGEDGKITYYNWLVKISAGKLHIFQPADAPGKRGSRSDLLQTFEKLPLSTTPTISYSVYNLGREKQKAAAEAIVAAMGESGNKVTLFSPNRSVDIDLTKSKWRAASDGVIARLTAMNGLNDEVKAHGFTKVEQTRLPFYENTRLIRASGAWKPESLVLYFLDDGESLYQLNGLSPVIHEYNKSHKLLLNDKTVAAYLWYFGFFVRGEAQPFLVLNSAGDRYFPNDAKRDLKRKLVSALETPRCKQRSETQFECELMMLYSGSVFEATMTIDSDGKVAMPSDKPLLSGFPLVDAPVTVAEAGDRFELKYHPKMAQVMALHKKIQSNGETPYLLANGRDKSVGVPAQYLDNKGKVILDISEKATTGLVFQYDTLKFSARFAQKSHSLMVPLSAMEALYAKETGQGLMLAESASPRSQPRPQPEPQPQPAPQASAQTEPAKPAPSRQQAWIHDSPVENGVRKQYLYSFARTALGNYANPFLRVECSGGGLQVAVMWGKPMKNMYSESSNHRAVRVNAKFGQNGWRTLAWSLARDRFVSYPPTAFNTVGSGLDSAIFSLLGMDTLSKRNSAMFDWNARSFVNLIRGNDSLVLSARDSSNRDVTLSVDLRGYDALARRHFSSRCR